MKKYGLIGEQQKIITSCEIEERKSKFISYVYRVENEEQVDAILQEIEKQNKRAKHIVYAYTFVNGGRYTDDKEPQGTAGKPIYGLLEKENLVNVLIVVVRYFGGILLGTGPLTRTYLEVAKIALDRCQKEEYVEYETVRLETEYKDEEKTIKHVKKVGGNIKSIERSDRVILTVKLPKNNK